jgi:hypothetical protein
MNRIGNVVGAAVTVAVLLILLTATDIVPGWLGVALAACLAPVGVLVGRSRRPEAPPPRVEYVPTPAPPPPAVQIQAAPLPTADPDYRFLLSCVACWRLLPGGSTPAYAEEVARRAVVARAAQLAADEQPGSYDLVRHKLDGVLAEPQTDNSRNIEIWAHSVVLTLPNDDMQRQHDLAAIRKDEQVWEHRRNYERNVRSYLFKEVLPSTGSTVVWWLAQDPKQVRETASLIDTLGQLSAAANNRPVDPALHPSMQEPVRLENGATQPAALLGFDGGSPNGDRAEPVTRIVHQLADTVYAVDDEARRARLADVLAKLLADDGRDDLATRIRTEFNAPDFDVLDTDAVDDVEPASGPAADESSTGRHGLSSEPTPVPLGDQEPRPPAPYSWPTGSVT